MPSVCWYCCSEPKDIGWAGPVTVPTLPPSPTPAPAVAPTPKPAVNPTPVPVESPVAQPTNAPVDNGDPLVCSDLNAIAGINIDRICKDGGCCDPVRSATDHCHFAYDYFGDTMGRVCSECCNPPKQLAPPPPLHPVYPPIQCSGVNNPFRICKPNSCCDPVASTSSHCRDVYEQYGDSMGSICWYCCSEPKEVDPSVLSNARKLEGGNSTTSSTVVTEPHERFFTGDLKMHPSNFEPNLEAEEEHLALLKEYRRIREEEESRSSATHVRRLNSINYDNVPYSPYQWLREVKTEYYFRYEGKQMVPPCFGTAHYRVMKDPIRVHPTQVAELERLLAWRISPKGSGFKECENDTAGKSRAGSNGNAVDLNRPLQSYSNIHRKVFCECDDWDSKFQEDIDWCELGNENQRWRQICH